MIRQPTPSIAEYTARILADRTVPFVWVEPVADAALVDYALTRRTSSDEDAERMIELLTSDGPRLTIDADRDAPHESR